VAKKDPNQIEISSKVAEECGFDKKKVTEVRPSKINFHKGGM